MAQRLFLTNNDGTETIDLLTGVLRVTNWGWSTQPTSLQQRVTALPFGIQANSLGYPQVIETFNVVATGCQDDIRDAIRQIEVFLEHAKAYMDDPVYHDPHWLQWQSEGEDKKRSLISGGGWQWRHSPPDSWPMVDSVSLLLNIALTRHPMWEDVDVGGNWSQPDGISSVGGTLDFNVAGRVPARLAMSDLSCDDMIGESDAVTKLWMGFRPEYYGLANFQPIWQCQSLVALTPGHSTLDVDTADHVDATAYNGYTAMVTFNPANPDMDRRLYIDLWQGPNGGTRVNASHFAGRYLVLCRCFCDLGVYGTEYPLLQMRSGYTGHPWRMTVHDPAVIQHTAAKYVELGQIQIPPPGTWDGIPALAGTTADLECGEFTIELYAQSLDAVATYLHLDVLILIPCDYFIKVEDANTCLEDLGLTNRQAAIIRNPDERLFAYNHEGLAPTPGGRPMSSATAMPNQWYVPPGNSQLVLAAERDAEQVITDDLTGVFMYYPRWTSYRE